MTDPTSYDTPTARRRAAGALSHTWTAAAGDGWLWDPFAEAAELCARCAAESLLGGMVDSAHEWAAAYRLLRDRVERGNREIHERVARRRRERAKAVVA